MRTLLLSAGLGTRLRPLTDTVPKCLVPIQGRPLLDYWLDLLNPDRERRVLINTHHLADRVLAHVQESRFSAHISVVFEQYLLGTAGTLLQNRDFFVNGPAMLVHADNLSLFNPDAFVERYFNRPAGVEITMMTFTTPAPESCGIVEIGENGIVRRFHEKVKAPPGNLANAAVYVVSPVVFEFLSELRKPIIDFSTEVIPHFLGRINTYHNDFYHRDIGTPDSLRAAEIEYPTARRRFESERGAPPC